MYQLKPHERILIDESVAMLANMVDSNQHLTYVIMTLIYRHLKKKKISCSRLVEIEGILNNISNELHRKLVAPLEDEKVTPHELEPILNNQIDLLRKLILPDKTNSD
jgi:hypothetical protein